jgi:hypothetical protein
VIGGKPGQHGDLGRMGHGVDHEQVVQAGGRQHDRLPHGRHRQPARARLDLPPREIRALMRLVVRADAGGAHLPKLARQPVDVALRGVDVEHEGRGDQFLA